MSVRVFEGKVSREGRIQLPKQLRELLGASEGTVLKIVVTPEGVQLVNPSQLLMQVWAANTGGDGGDSGEDVRALRDAEVITEAAEGEEPDERSEEQITADLMRALGISA